MGCGTSKASTKSIVTPLEGKNRSVIAPNDHSTAVSSQNDQSHKTPSAKSHSLRPDNTGKVSDGSAMGRDGSAKSASSIDSGIGNDSRDGSANLGRANLPPPGQYFLCLHAYSYDAIQTYKFMRWLISWSSPGLKCIWDHRLEKLIKA